MSRRHKHVPIFDHTKKESEAWDKAAWHRRHRVSERVRLQAEGEDYTARSHRERSSTWSMAKDGKHYWAPGLGTPAMRK
jgi:hypothetical protein